MESGVSLNVSGTCSGCVQSIIDDHFDLNSAKLWALNDHEIDALNTILQFIALPSVTDKGATFGLL